MKPSYYAIPALALAAGITGWNMGAPAEQMSSKERITHRVKASKANNIFHVLEHTQKTGFMGNSGENPDVQLLLENHYSREEIEEMSPMEIRHDTRKIRLDQATDHKGIVKLMNTVEMNIGLTLNSLESNAIDQSVLLSNDEKKIFIELIREGVRLLRKQLDTTADLGTAKTIAESILLLDMNAEFFWNTLISPVILGERSKQDALNDTQSTVINIIDGYGGDPETIITTVVPEAQLIN